MISKANQLQALRTDALDTLRRTVPVGATLHTITRYVSASGMLRTISVVYIGKDGTPRDLDYLIATAGIFPRHPSRDGLKVTGGGMDMGYHVVYSLGRALYPDGVRCTGRHGSTATRAYPRCQSNDHTNDRGEADYRRSRLHADGGYAFDHRHL